MLLRRLGTVVVDITSENIYIALRSFARKNWEAHHERARGRLLAATHCLSVEFKRRRCWVGYNNETLRGKLRLCCVRRERQGARRRRAVAISNITVVFWIVGFLTDILCIQ